MWLIIIFASLLAIVIMFYIFKGKENQNYMNIYLFFKGVVENLQQFQMIHCDKYIQENVLSQN